jgi:F0F1-type ATP synthase assembly protein I
MYQVIKNFKNMESKKLTELTEEELMKEEKKRKEALKIFRFVSGLMIGAAIFSTVVKGFSTSTLLPVFFIPLFFSTQKNYKEVQAEIEYRKSQ